MRRGFSIFLVLFFALGPLTVLSPASEDASLPACCRREGAHHCAMKMGETAAWMVVPPGSPPIATTPSHCPDYPQHATVRNTPVFTLAAVSDNSAGLPVQGFATLAGSSAPFLNLFGSKDVRGPPAIPLD